MVIWLSDLLEENCLLPSDPACLLRSAPGVLLQIVQPLEGRPEVTGDEASSCDSSVLELFSLDTFAWCHNYLSSGARLKLSCFLQTSMVNIKLLFHFNAC